MTVKEVLDGIQVLLSSLAIVGAGVWFYRRRKLYPRVSITHNVQHWPISASKTLLRVEIFIENKGDTIFEISAWSIAVSQIRPYPADVIEAIEKDEDPVRLGETEIEWDPLYEKEFNAEVWPSPIWPLEIEPGEQEDIPCDFIIDGDVETVSIYTHFTNPAKAAQEIGWNKTSVHELRGETYANAKETNS